LIVADIEDVSATLASTIAGLLTGSGGVPLNGVQTDVFPGWPKPNDLKAALAAGAVQVSVYPMPGASGSATRHERDWELLTAAVVTTTVTISNGIITFGGSITLPLNVSVNSESLTATYGATDSDTLTSLASNVAAACVASGIRAAASGAVLTLASGDPYATVSLGGQGVLGRENAREKQIFQITTWAPSQALRQATAAAFEPYLMGIDTLTLPDKSAGHIFFMKSLLNDHSELENLYRKDVWFTVEYPYVETTPAYSVTLFTSTIVPISTPLFSPMMDTVDAGNQITWGGVPITWGGVPITWG
jgi:hypothetical protein